MIFTFTIRADNDTTFGKSVFAAGVGGRIPVIVDGQQLADGVLYDYAVSDDGCAVTLDVAVPDESSAARVLRKVSPLSAFSIGPFADRE